jgi:hypothetical protein
VLSHGRGAAQVLATFWHGGLKHVVAAPLEPVFVIGAPVPSNQVGMAICEATGLDL